MALTLPPLRERNGDILLLSQYFLRRFQRGQAERRKTFSKEALDYLLSYEWPGNIRELRNVVERAVILSDDRDILPKHLPSEIVDMKGKSQGFELKDLIIPEQGLPLEEIEREVIKKALSMTDGNLSKAARLLSVSRDTLRYRIGKLGILI